MTVHNDCINRDKAPLITAIILHYENGDTIFETIDSVLGQTYPNIELVISDDCSKEFDPDRIKTYVESNKESNIVSCVVRVNEINQGAVRHCETIRLQTKGEIELLITAGDIWADQEVFSSFVDRFNELGQEAEFITSQIEICDENLNSISEYFISPFVLQMLKTGDMNSLKDAMAKTCILPGSGSAFRRSFFERIGHLSKDYWIAKDWGAYLRWLRMGRRVYLLDRITLKHRRGVISRAPSEFPPEMQAYWRDKVNVFTNEVEPYRSCFSDYGYQGAEEAFNDNQKRLMSFGSRTTIILRACGDWEKTKVSLDAILRFLCLNTEMVVECQRQISETIIDYLSKEYVFRPEIHRVRVIEYCEEPTQADNLVKESTGDRVLILAQGESIDALLYDWIWSTKDSSVKVVQSYTAFLGAQPNTALFEQEAESDVDAKTEPPRALRERCSKLLRKHRKNIKRWSSTHAIILSFVLLIILHCAFAFATLLPNPPSFVPVLEVALVLCIVVQWFIVISRCVLKLVLAARA